MPLVDMAPDPVLPMEVPLDTAPEMLPVPGAAMPVTSAPGRMAVPTPVLMLPEVLLAGGGRVKMIVSPRPSFRRFAVPAGRSTNRFSYVPYSFWIGVGLAALSAFALCWAWRRAVIRG